MQQCRFSSPLSDEQLLSVLDGEASPAVERHLADCPACSARLTTFYNMYSGMKSKLHRYDCPTPDELTDYHLGLSAQEEVVRTHLEYCASCRSEIAMFETLLAADNKPAEPAPMRLRLPRLGEIIASLVPRGLTAAPALRGEETHKMTAQAEGVTVFLEVEALPEGYTLTGQVLAADSESWIGALVEVRQNDTVAVTTRLDDLGEFRCEMLPDGNVALRVTSAAGRSVVIRDIPLNP